MIMEKPSFRVIIVGGGITGLSAAFTLQEESQRIGWPVSCTLIEKTPSWGGKIVTDYMDGLLLEGGPDSFLTIKPWAMDLCERLGLKNELIQTNESQNLTFAYSRGRLRKLPQGLVSFVPTRVGSLFSSGLISWVGMARMGLEWFVPARSHGSRDETLASFFSRRVGREAFDRLIEPLVAGIYAGDAEELSLRATFPRLYELEGKYGSLMKGILAQRSAPSSASFSSTKPRSLFMTLRGGLGDLIGSLVKRIEASGTQLRQGQPVKALRISNKHGKKYQVILDNDEVLKADSVILATPAYVTADLLRPLHQPLGGWLNEIPYASTATISLAYQTNEMRMVPRGFGFVVPRVEGKSLIAATWSSLKWAGRTPPGETLIRCYVGGTGRESILERDDSSLVAYVKDELRLIAGIRCQPLLTKIYRWPRALPQYTAGHLDRVQQIHHALRSFDGLYLTGAAYNGIGIPDCIREGSQTARELVRNASQRAGQ